MEYKVLSIAEPYASLFLSHKHYETRAKAINYRGPLLIQATEKAWPASDQLNQWAGQQRHGEIFLKGNLVDCHKIDKSFREMLTEEELKCGFYDDGRYAWEIRDIEPIEPIKHRGYPWLWSYEMEDVNE